ncbi:hypothetical protein FOA43_000448 [Brettanomyces nanus]|uniref:Glutathione synthetase n=1 Tax=Eeniella nana TaxID=13502 RepID=A0A875RZ04_EENNA|nr:uncharacterized protein FOA43_000448 [Brettanomyces nanus]QPG73142.1 hypothetical protein FOA43_000448 [Brettanomyces nanus]
MPLQFPQLHDEDESKLIHNLTQYGLSKGLIMYPISYQEYQVNLAPLTLFPTPFPRSQFEKAKSLATAYSELYANVVSQHDWLINVIEALAPVDSSFTGMLYQSYLKAQKKGIVQPISLGIARSDYMYDTTTQQIKQVEFNTVSVSFAGLSRCVGQLHKFCNDNGLYTSNGDAYYDDSDLPVSDSSLGLARGLRDGVSCYEAHHTDGYTKTIVLFVIQPNERNAFDQRAIEYTLFDDFGIVSKRIDLARVTSEVVVDEISHRLYYEGREVSVVYYRSGYSPHDFEVKEAWDCRVLLETTLAIKCPSLLAQLSGAKKIQQLLTDESILAKFYDKQDKSELHSTFCKIYPLDDSARAAAAKKLAFECPENFVLKPQREGGGNNIYKEDIPGFLRSIPEEEWSGYILMELIHPPVQKNILLRDGQLAKDGIVSELGIYSSFLFNEYSGEMINAAYQGYLLRSKISSSNEGGVAAGYGCVDSIYLY